MTFEEKIFYGLMEKIYTISICKITKIDPDNSFCEVQPVIAGSLITDVPIFQLGNTSINIKIKLKVGDIVPVMHCRDDVSLFLGSGKETTNDLIPKFAKSNAFILPFCVNSANLGFDMPNTDIEINGDIKINGDIEVSGEIKASEVEANNVKLSTHTHGGVKDGPSNTAPPNPV